MVDVGGKPVTRRRAMARGVVQLSAESFKRLAAGNLAKGDALAVARIAGICAAKKTSEIVPLCHPLALDSISVEIALDQAREQAVATAIASVRGKTGVEMEALTAVAGACLALYDMVKGIDRSVAIREIILLQKSGGRTGRFVRRGSRIKA